MLEQSSKIALAAFLHDLGKFAQRAKIEVDAELLNNNKHLYCPHRKQYTDDKGWFSHVHAAYTGIALDLIEPYMPELTGNNCAPFGDWKSRNVDDSFINAAAKHHRPETFLQWIIATADRVASGFDRDSFEQYNQGEDKTRSGHNHYTARQLTLFEQIHQAGMGEQGFNWRYPLKPLSVNSIFPQPAETCESKDNQHAQQEYHQLWEQFKSALNDIPASHRQNWALWLDHFETAWGVFTQAIPAATAFHVKPDVSLYDHSRVAAALATALWRYHEERGETDAAAAKLLSEQHQSWQEKKFLLIQGDFFGIQDFIFASGGETSKKAAKLLRGRSFYVSLLCECAALKVLEALSLPPTSQVINAAGKFMIVAPNTQQTRRTLQQVRNELDQWFLQHSYGQAGVGLAWTEACCNDFKRSEDDRETSPYRQLISRLFEQLEIIKAQRFQLCEMNAPKPIFTDFLNQFENKLEPPVCQIDGRSPAIKEDKDGFSVGALAQDQLDIGCWLTSKERILISRESLGIGNSLKIPLFDFNISFIENEAARGQFGQAAQAGKILRLWDFSLPKEVDKPLWNGYARRAINAYVPWTSEQDLTEADWDKYIGIDEPLELGQPKNLNHLACSDRKPHPEKQDKWLGISALTTLKGDVDNLGLIFQNGLGNDVSFTKMAALSRQMNAFFSIYLPYLCKTEYPNSYTVFAGGDDFFLIGPWLSQIKLADTLRKKFRHYVAENPNIHFSVGLSTTKPGLPVNQIGEMAEQALEKAKAHNPEKLAKLPKNAVSCFNQLMFWQEFEELIYQRQEALQRLITENDLSTGYVYGLLHLIDMQEKVQENPENALWHSYFAYRTARMLEKKTKNTETRKRKQVELAQEIAHAGIIRHGGNYRVTLFCHLYQQRD
jgi:CRISPR-associated protein Csm1